MDDQQLPPGGATYEMSEANKQKHAEKEARRIARDKRRAERPIKIGQASQRIGDLGDSMMKRVTMPIILLVVGAVTFPIGIIFWLIGLGMVFGPRKKK